MPISLPIAMLIGSGIAGGATIYGAKKQADASSKAADVEGQAAKDALEFQKQQYAIQQAQRQPYVNFSTGALGKLSDLLGLQNPMTAGTGLPQNPNMPTGPFTPYEPPGTTHASGPVDFVGGAGRPDAMFGGTQGPPIPPGGMQGPNGLAPTASASGFVQMIGPDGSVESVPSHLATFAQARGAKLLGGAL